MDIIYFWVFKPSEYYIKILPSQVGTLIGIVRIYLVILLPRMLLPQYLGIIDTIQEIIFFGIFPCMMARQQSDEIIKHYGAKSLVGIYTCVTFTCMLCSFGYYLFMDFNKKNDTHG